MKTLLVAALTLCFSSTVLAADIEAGKAKAVVCGACHGADGKAVMPNYPNLAGQNETYLKLAISAYQKGERTGGQAAIMAGMVGALTATDIDNLAAYFASLTPK